MAYKMNGFSGFHNSPLKHEDKRKHIHQFPFINYWDEKNPLKPAKTQGAKKIENKPKENKA